jgi:hypothetical protein
MNDLIDFFADPRARLFVISPHATHYGDDVDAEPAVGAEAWTPTSAGLWEPETVEVEGESTRWKGTSPTSRRSVADSSVSAGLRAVAPDAARWHEYFAEKVEAAVTARLRDYDERLSRLESAVADRRATVQRGDELLTDAIAALTAKLGADFDDVPKEEALELWKLVDFSGEDEDEE